MAVSLPWLPHPSATANDVESISVKNATESAFMMRPFLGFNTDNISKNAYIFKYFWILPKNRGKNRLHFVILLP
jgi:regulation of enolase protein 1 (concanavalin A-like superfamily)